MLYDKDGVETTGAMGNKPAQWPNKVRRGMLVCVGWCKALSTSISSLSILSNA